MLHTPVEMGSQEINEKIVEGMSPDVALKKLGGRVEETVENHERVFSFVGGLAEEEKKEISQIFGDFSQKQNEKREKLAGRKR